MKTSASTFLIVIFSLSGNSAYSQTRIQSPVKIVSKIDSSFFYIPHVRSISYLPVRVNDRLFEFIRSEKSLLVIRNKTAVDTLVEKTFKINFDSENNIFVSKGDIYLIGMDENSEYGIYQYSTKSGGFNSRFESASYIFDLSEEGFFTSPNGTTLAIIDTDNFQVSSLIDLGDKICQNCRIVDVNSFAETKKILIYTGKGTGDSYDDVQYFVYDLSTKNLTEVSNRILPICTQLKSDLNSYEYRIDKIRSKFFPNSLVVSHSGCVEYKLPFLLNAELNVTDELVNRYRKSTGSIVVDDASIGYFGVSMTDKKETAYITEIPAPRLESCYKKVMKNTILTTADVRGLSKYQLDLLMNFIYAKHNMRFNDLYNQIYFNQFIFYRSQVKSRNNEVSSFFTIEDKESLKLVRSYSKRL